MGDLDEALLRPGRSDIHVRVRAPDVRARKASLEHTPTPRVITETVSKERNSGPDDSYYDESPFRF